MTQTWPMRSMPILLAAHVSKISSTTCTALASQRHHSRTEAPAHARLDLRVMVPCAKRAHLRQAALLRALRHLRGGKSDGRVGSTASWHSNAHLGRVPVQHAAVLLAMLLVLRPRVSLSKRPARRPVSRMLTRAHSGQAKKRCAHQSMPIESADSSAAADVGMMPCEPTPTGMWSNNDCASFSLTCKGARRRGSNTDRQEVVATSLHP